jgi:hypothetical protein
MWREPVLAEAATWASYEDDLLERLVAVVQATDPVPDGVVAAARAAFVPVVSPAARPRQRRRGRIRLGRILPRGHRRLGS